jgi:hypothetical protein
MKDWQCHYSHPQHEIKALDPALYSFVVRMFFSFKTLFLLQANVCGDRVLISFCFIAHLTVFAPSLMATVCLTLACADGVIRQDV